jgi:hypothetical protein
MISVSSIKLFVRKRGGPIVLMIEVADASRLIRVILTRQRDIQDKRLIGPHTHDFIDRMGIESVETKVVFGSDHENCTCPIDAFQAEKVQICTV